MKYIKFKTFLFCLRLKKCAKPVLSAWENGEEEPAGHKRVHFRVGRFSPFSRILLLIKFARISVPKKTILSQKYPPFSKNYTSIKNKNTLLLKLCRISQIHTKCIIHKFCSVKCKKSLEKLYFIKLFLKI